jgi:hypothetical protein
MCEGRRGRGGTGAESATGSKVRSKKTVEMQLICSAPWCLITVALHFTDLFARIA